MLNALIRRPRTQAVNGPLLVLLHGLGADERDLIGLADSLDDRLTVVSLQAPLQCENGGYAWFELRWDEHGVHANGAQALLSRDLLIECLTELPDQLGLKPSRTFLGGFSQGAMMSLGASLRIPKKLDGVILLSGRLLPEFIEDEPEPGFAQLPFYVQHGMRDQILPVSGGRQIRAFLEERGGTMEYHEYGMAHGISYESLADLSTWLTSKLK